MRNDTPQVARPPYRQVHAHSTGNRNSTAQNEYDYMMRKDLNSGFYTHVVGNGKIIQTAPTNRGAYDVGGGWNYETYAAVELIESHKTKEEFMIDYRLYVELLRNLAKEANISVTLDTNTLEGIKTHAYCTANQPYNNSDHIDPYPYLQRWGISKEQFKRDIEKGVTQTQTQTQPTENSKGEVMTMFAIYWKKNTKTGGKDAYFFNGAELKHIPNPLTINVLKTIYRDNNGKNIPEYDWSAGNNPTAGLMEKMFG